MDTVTGTDIERAAEWLIRGQVVAIPTETVYGLAANACDVEAVVQVFSIKQRPTFDPLIVHLAGTVELYRYAYSVPDQALILADAFWPGPLTLVLPKSNVIPDIVTSGLDTVGLRVPSHPVTLELLKQLPFPLAAPSANPFGYISPTTAAHVIDQLGGKIPYVLDGGPCKVGVESTIVGFEGDEVVVYRLGGLPLEELRRVVKNVNMRTTSSSDPRAPGMLDSHYAPRCPLVVGDLEELLKMYSSKRAGVISFNEDYSTRHGVVHAEKLSASGDLREAAARLFAAMRRADASGVEVILTELVPEEGLGRAINDRLLRAAHR